MNADHVASVSASAGSPGTAIRAARTRAGLSIEELASRTRLARATLEFMENDAFDQLLEPVYVRGYYRKCARVLDIPEQPLIDAYDALYKPPPKAVPQRVRLASGGELGSSPRLSARFAILAPVAAVVLISIIWMWRQPATPPAGTQTVQMIDPTLPSADTVPATQGTDTGPATDPATPAEPAQPVIVPDASGALVAPDPAAVAAVTETPVAPPEPTPVGTRLVLEFDAISWAKVEDSAGKALLSGVISAGETQTLDGRPPYAVFLGNAPGVKVSFGGLPVDLKPFTKANSTARFSVPAASAN